MHVGHFNPELPTNLKPGAKPVSGVDGANKTGEGR